MPMQNGLPLEARSPQANGTDTTEPNDYIARMIAGIREKSELRMRMMQEVHLQCPGPCEDGRLHCTLPCLAMGTPVWTVVGQAMKNGRFGGNEEFMNLLSLGADGIVQSPVPPSAADGRFHLGDRPPVRMDHLPCARALAERCRAFMQAM